MSKRGLDSPVSSGGRLAVFQGTTRLICVLLLAVCAVAVMAAPASAVEYRHNGVAAEFGPDGTSGTSFGSISQVFYNPANEQLVALSNYPREIFTFETTASGTITPVASGNFAAGGAGTTGLTVDPSNGNIYEASESAQTVYGYTATGATLPEFPITGYGETCGIDVNSEGTLFVGDYTHNSIELFHPSGEQFGSIESPVSGPCLVQLDHSNGDLYVAGYYNSVYRIPNEGAPGTPEYNPGSANLVTSNSVSAMAVDPSTHYLYITSGEKLEAFTPAGELVESLQMPGYPQGVTIGSNDTAFVGLGSKIAEIPYAAVPKAETGEAPSDIEVSGIADPNGAGPITECYFQWGESSNYSFNTETTPCTQSTPISTREQVSAVLPTLTVNHTYHYRLVLRNANRGGVAYGQDQTLSPGYVHDLRTQPATEVARVSARLNASFTGDGSETTYAFKWGKDSFAPGQYEHETPEPPASVGSPTGATPLHVDLTGLVPDTKYRFVVVATNPEGTSVAQQRTFTTLPSVAGVQTLPPTELSAASLTLNGEFVGNGEDTSYYFEWGPTTAYGHQAPDPAAEAGEVTGPTPVSAEITEFEGFKTYHYRLVASNAVGTTYGEDETVIAPDAQPPAISGTSIISVDGSSARLGATINPHRWSTVYFFDYGTTTAYGSSTEIGGPVVGTSDAEQEVALEAGELQPNTLYHYRAVAINFAGTTVGPDQTFRTPGPPTLDALSASGLTSTSALVSVSVVPDLRATNVRFEFGPSLSYGSQAATTGAGADAAPHTVTALLSGLSPATTYHFRAVASNALGSSQSSDATFTTLAGSPPLPPPKPKVSCKRGFVKRHGRCVRKPHRKKHRHHTKRHHGKPHRHG